MNKAEIEEVTEIVNNAMNTGISLYVERKSVAKLFTAVIAANVATMFVISGITGVMKKRLAEKAETENKKDDTDDGTSLI